MRNLNEDNNTEAVVASFASTPDPRLTVQQTLWAAIPTGIRGP